MPPLHDIARLKRLADLFVLAMKADPAISVRQNNAAIDSLMDYGLTERQAEMFLNEAFSRLESGLLRGSEQLLDDVSIAFRKREHAFILSQVQEILECGEISDPIQEFYDLCCKYLYHG